jgi:hypothetical protein
MRKTVLFFIGVLLSLASLAQSTLNFEKSFRLSQSLRERALCFNKIGNKFYLFGFSLACTGSNCLNSSSMTVLDQSGNFLWATKTGHEETLNPAKTVHDDMGNMYVLGTFYVQSPGHSKFFIYKIDTTGQLAWTKYYGNDQSLSPLSFMISGGNLYASGYITTDDYDFHGVILKTDLNGNQVWLKSYTDPVADDVKCYDIIDDGSGNLLAAFGYRDWPNLKSTVVRLNQSGDSLGSVTINGYDMLQQIVRNPDNSVTGILNISGVASNTSYGAIVFRTNPQLTALNWAKAEYTSLYYPEEACAGYEGEVIFSGARGSINYTREGFILSFDSTGMLNWSKTYGSDEEDGFYDVKLTGNCQYLACGYSHNTGIYSYDWYVAQFNRDGQTGGNYRPVWNTVWHDTTLGVNTCQVNPATISDLPTDFPPLISAADLLDSVAICSVAQTAGGCQPVVEPNAVQVTAAKDNLLLYPNPVANTLAIANLPDRGVFHAVIMNSVGQVMISGEVNGTNNSMDVSQLASGIYFLKLEGENISFRVSFMKSR